MTTHLRPMLIAALAVLCGATMDALIKRMAVDAPVFQVVGWRYLVGAIIVGVVVIIRRPKPITLASTRFQILRSVMGLMAGVCFFYAVTQLALSEATVMLFAAALMISPFAWLILGERISVVTGLATLVGFAGVAVTQLGGDVSGAPADANRLYGVIAGLSAATFYALSMVMLRMRSEEDDPVVIVAFSNILPALCLMPFTLQLPLRDVATLVWPLVTAGACGVGMWWLMTLAYTSAPAQKLAPLEYTALIWATLYGFYWFEERPGWSLYAGAAIVIAACLIVAFETHFTARSKAKAPASDVLH